MSVTYLVCTCAWVCILYVCLSVCVCTLCVFMCREGRFYHSTLMCLNISFPAHVAKLPFWCPCVWMQPCIGLTGYSLQSAPHGQPCVHATTCKWLDSTIHTHTHTQTLLIAIIHLLYSRLPQYYIPKLPTHVTVSVYTEDISLNNL